MDVLGYFSSFVASLGDFFNGVFAAVGGIFSLVTASFPPVFLSLFMFAVTAFIVGVIIRLL